ncbi:hypothetical protein KBC04_00935 [Candidatus Babeliales bacterium]|nr:hypothetical protein [Candidatus Babeliales bacterium]MBP9843700.1 hypothetical protein [Candidatus Babeliales bacterium]
MAKHRIKKCEQCNTEMKKLTDCITCDQENIMKSKVAKVMGEFKRHTLHSHSENGPVVTQREQAVAIALHEGRKAAKVKIKKQK